MAEAVGQLWPTAAEAMRPMSHVDDPVARVTDAIRTMLVESATSG